MNAEEIFQLITRNVREIVPGLENEGIDRSSMLSPLGLDSIGRAELIEKTMEDLQLTAQRHDFNAVHNLGELADLFARTVKSQRCQA